MEPGVPRGIAELVAFVDGLADDAEAVANGCRLTWSNGMVERFINKVKWMKRSSYGQAGFPLLQRRVGLASSLVGAAAATSYSFSRLIKQERFSPHDLAHNL